MRSSAVGYALLTPSLFGVVTFLLLPMLVAVWLSLHRWDLLGPIQYVGLDNWYSVLTDPSFGTSLLVTALFIAIVVPTQSVLGLVAAAMLARGLPGSGLFRTLYVLPWICAPLAIYIAIRYWRAPAGVIPRSRIRYYLGIGLATVQLVAWTWLIAFMIARR